MATGGNQFKDNANTIERLKNVYDGVYHDTLIAECEAIKIDLKIFYKRLQRKIKDAKQEIQNAKHLFTLSNKLKNNISCVINSISLQSDTETSHDTLSIVAIHECNDILRDEPGFVEMSIDNDYRSLIEFDKNPIKITKYKEKPIVSAECIEQQTKRDTIVNTLKDKGKLKSDTDKIVRKQKEEHSDEVDGNKTLVQSGLIKRSQYQRMESKYGEHLGAAEQDWSLTDRNTTPVVKQSLKHQGMFNFGDCADVKLFENYFVTTSNDKMYKFNRHSKHKLGEIKLKGGTSMCKIRRSFYVGVIQINSYISVINTKEALQVLYRIKTDRPYMYICHYCTFVDTGLKPDPSFQFAVSYARNNNGVYVESIDLVKAKPANKHTRITDFEDNAKVFWSSKQHGVGIFSIDVFSDYEIIIALSKKVVCFDTNGNPKWEIALNKNATCVCTRKQEAYICVKDEARVMSVDREGNIIDENILEKTVRMEPHSICFFEDTVLIKEFDTTQWKSMVHEDKHT